MRSVFVVNDKIRYEIKNFKIVLEIFCKKSDNIKNKTKG